MVLRRGERATRYYSTYTSRKLTLILLLVPAPAHFPLTSETLYFAAQVSLAKEFILFVVSRDMQKLIRHTKISELVINSAPKWRVRKYKKKRETETYR